MVKQRVSFGAANHQDCGYPPYIDELHTAIKLVCVCHTKSFENAHEYTLYAARVCFNGCIYFTSLPRPLSGVQHKRLTVFALIEGTGSTRDLGVPAHRTPTSLLAYFYLIILPARHLIISFVDVSFHKRHDQAMSLLCSPERSL